MLRLTKLTDYGILLMTYMAAANEDTYTAAMLAEHTHVPLPTVSKVMQMLLHQGLLESIRGAHGGYRLARPSAQISVGEIIRSLEGSIALTECNLEGSECDQLPFCATSSHWLKINDAIRDALDMISLADMARPDYRPVFRIDELRAPILIRGIADGC
jgi:FeS assembly SUF system regulator